MNTPKQAAWGGVERTYSNIECDVPMTKALNEKFSSDLRECQHIIMTANPYEWTNEQDNQADELLRQRGWRFTVTTKSLP